MHLLMRDRVRISELNEIILYMQDIFAIHVSLVHL